MRQKQSGVTRRPRAARPGIWTLSSHCRAFCGDCVRRCLYTKGHTRTHGAHHFPSCRSRKFNVPRMCSKCDEIEIRADWSICRPCALLIELKQTSDFGEALKIT